MKYRVRLHVQISPVDENGNAYNYGGSPFSGDLNNDIECDTVRDTLTAVANVEEAIQSAINGKPYWPPGWFDE